jgi:signal transduction histidine kinase
MQDKVSNERADTLEGRRIDLLFEHKIHPIVLAALIAIMTCAFLYHQGADYAIYWLIYNLSFLLIRGIMINYYNGHLSMDLEQKIRYEKLYLVPLFFSGLSWGATSFLFLNHVSIMGALFIVIMTCGILFGGLQGVVASIAGASTFIISIVGPYFAFGPLQGTVEGVLIGVATIPFFVVLLKAAKTNLAYMKAALQTSVANQSMIDELFAKMELEQELQKERIQNFHTNKLASMGEMSAGVAHEINNPLTVLVANLGRLRKMLLDHDMIATDEDDRSRGEKMLRSVDQMDQMVVRITGIVSNLKGLSRRSEDDPFELVTLQKLIDISMPMVKGRLDSSMSELQVELESDFPIKINCHSSEISQVMINLINNACDAIAGLDERWIKLRANKESTKIIFSVIDSGTPPKQEVISRLFEPFYTTKEAGKGTGLGLSLSAQIMKHHGGELVFDHSSPNTKFDLVFKLPPQGEGDGA